MKKSKKAFSFIELFLILAIIGLLAAIFVPATAKVKYKTRLAMIDSQLEKIVSVAKDYMKERNLTQVNYKTLVDAKRVSNIYSILGESYNTLTIKKAGDTISLEIPNSEKHEYTYY